MRYFLTVPLPISANEMWKKWRGRIVLNPAGKEYKRQIGLRCKVAGMKPLAGPVAVVLNVYAARGDLDNYEPLLLDALQAYAYTNDSQVKDKHTTMHLARENQRIEVEIVSLGEK